MRLYGKVTELHLGDSCPCAAVFERYETSGDASYNGFIVTLPFPVWKRLRSDNPYHYKHWRIGWFLPQWVRVTATYRRGTERGVEFIRRFLWHPWRAGYYQ